MKKNLLLITAVIIASQLFSLNTVAQGTLIHYWHFNNWAHSISLPNLIAIDADYSVIDTSKTKIVYTPVTGTSSAYVTYMDTIAASADDTVNLRMGAIGGNAVRARNPSDSMQLLFYIPTTGFKNIVINYASQSSSVAHGQTHQLFDYSIDSGMTWRTAGLSQPTDSAWLIYHRTTVSFPTDTEVNNNPRFVFRIQFAGHTGGTSGNNRFDNVSVDGDSINVTEVKVLNIADEVQYSVYPMPSSNTISIVPAIESDKTISIYDAVGQRKYFTQQKSSMVNISKLDVGVYYLYIRDNNTGTENTVKFIKIK